MATQTWITGTAGDWSTAADWSSSVVPTATVDAVINNSSAVTVNGTAVAQSLTLSNSTLTDSGTLTLGTLTLQAGGVAQSTFTLSGGTLSAQTITSFDGSGLVGYGTISGTVNGHPTIVANGGTLKVEGSLNGDGLGYFQIDSGTLELGSATSLPINFNGDQFGILKLDAPAAFTGSIYQIVVGSTIDLTGITASSATYIGTTLTINETNSQHLTYNNISGSLAGDIVATASNNNGGTLVYWAKPPVTDTWITGTAGDWSTAADWSSSVVPTATVDAVINNSSAVTVNGTAVAQSLTLSNSTLTDSGTLTLGTLTLQAGGVAQSTFTLSGGTLSAQTITSFDGSGLVGYGTISGTVNGHPTIVANGGTLKVEGSLNGDGLGYFQIDSGTLELGSATSLPINFNGDQFGILKLDAPAAFTGSIYQIVVGSTIDLTGITASSATYIGTTLTINETNSQHLTYNNISGSLAGDIVATASNNNGGTLVYWAKPPVTDTWITGTAGDWSTAADWSSSVVPTATVDAVINNSSAVTVNGTAVAQSLTLSNSTLTDSGTLTLGTLTLQAGGVAQSTFTLSGGTLSAQTITSFDGSGLVGYGTISGTVNGHPTIVANGGTLKVEGSLNGDGLGYFQIDSGTLELGSATSLPINFNGDQFGILKLDAPAAFTGSIYQIVVGSTIDLTGITASSATYIGTTLTINETNSQHLTYNNISGSLAGDIVATASNNNGGTLVYWAQPSIPPTVASISATTDNHATDLNAGHLVTINVSTSEAVTVKGIPTLQLNDNEVATYITGSGTNTLTFTYRVQPSDNVSDLQVTGLNLPSGVTIQDAAGNNLSGTVTATLGLQIETTPPTVTITNAGGLTNNPTQTVSGTVDAADAGTLVTLYDGTTAIGTAPVQSNGTWTDTITLRANGINSVTAQDTDAAGNTGTSNAVVYTVNAVGPIEQYLVATVDNHATNVTTGHATTLTLTTSEPVTVTGTPTLQLNDNEVATYASGSGGNALVFTYTVKAGDSTSDLQVMGLNLPAGATVQDAAGNSLANVTGNLALQINATTLAPTISSLTGVTDTGGADINASHLVTITMTTSEAVTVTGTPALQLNDGEVAGYIGGAGTNTLTFAYAVQTGAPGDNVADLQVTGLNLPTGSSIVDSTGHSLSGSSTADLGIKIDTTTVPATSVQQEIFGLYAALYGRATDSGGVSYWTGIVDQQSDGSGVTTANAASTTITAKDATVLGQQFVNTQNTYFNSLYGSLTDSAFINAMYVNIGGNAGDPGGIAYWANLLQQAEASNPTAAPIQAARAGLVGQFVHDLVDYNLAAGAAGLTSAQLLAATQRQAAVDNKILVSLALSDASQQAGGGILVVHTVGDAAYEAATTLIEGVTYNPATVTAAILGINTAVAHQDLSLI